FGSATRRFPLSINASASSIGWPKCLSMRERVSAARFSQARSMVCSSDDIVALQRSGNGFVHATRQSLAQRLPIGRGQGVVRFVGDQEKIFDALAERGDARIMHANAAGTKHLGHAGEQSR